MQITSLISCEFKNLLYTYSAWADTQIEEHSNQALIEVRGEKCSGSIITQYHILTAAQCIHEHRLQDIVVWYGKTNVSRSKYSAKRVEVHPLYNPKTVDYDVGIIWVC